MRVSGSDPAVTEQNSAPIHSPSAEAQSSLDRAGVLAESGRHDEARVAFSAAVCCPPWPVAHNEFGCYLLQTECFDEAVEQFAILLTWAKEQGDANWRAVASNNLAAVYRTMGRIDLAASLQQQSILAACEDDYQSCGDSHLACDLGNRANDAILAGKYDLAEKLLRRSLLVETAIESLEGQAADWGNLGLVAALQGNVTEGIRNLWRAYRLHLRAADDRGVGCDLLNLAELFGRLGRWRTAVRCLRRAVVQFERVDAATSAQRAQRLLEEAIRIADVLEHDPLLN